MPERHVDRRWVEAASWFVASELVRRHPECCIVETHPQGGHSDRLQVGTWEAPLQFKIQWSLNRTPGGAAHATPDLRTVTDTPWQDFYAAAPRELVAAMERAAGLIPVPRARATTPRTLTYRVIAGLVGSSVTARRPLRGVNLVDDGSWGARLRDAGAFAAALEDVGSRAAVRPGAYRYWLLTKEADADGTETVMLLHDSGRAWTGHHPDGVDLMAVYDQSGRDLTRLLHHLEHEPHANAAPAQPTRWTSPVRVPDPAASWADFFLFGHSYSGYRQLGESTWLWDLAREPVLTAVRRGTLGSDEGPGVDLLRGALFAQARADAHAGVGGFATPEVERLYREVAAELHRRTGGWVPWLGEPVSGPSPTTSSDGGSVGADAVILPFAWSLLAKKVSHGDPAYTPAQRARLRESMDQDLRKCSDMLTPTTRPPLVSAAAAAAAATLGVDLRQQTWHTQTKFDSDRSVFHFEHVTPISALRNEALEAHTVYQVMGALHTRLRVAWILKSENKRLSELGYNSVRPDPVAAYAEAGIELLPEQ